ncbi:DUF2523 family protein [Marinobacter sp. 2_MG-2023]|uniref:DUF2523 family protein n=1 Tax=Marinobacter sp. 2_MG-2023 TaxID=3062679 RepID=UPI0026E2BEFF|nr:DUF2523 family protein [Marinobacter sp. 2_MG-2023]MDO6444127.1 DUF2523 family protein [Marinobacter sp. 2_MG-2023]
MEFIADFFDAIWLFFTGIPALIDDWMVKAGAWIVIAATKAKIAFIGFSWNVAQEVLNQLNVSSTIETYWGQLDSQVLGVATFLKLPEAFNMIINARVTRYVMDVIG